MSQREFPATRLLILTLAVVLSIVAMVGYQLGQSRHSVWEGTNTINQNLLAAVSRLLEQHLLQIESSLDYTARRLEQVEDPTDFSIHPDMLFRAPVAQPDDQIFVLDNSGRVLHALRDYDGEQIDRAASHDYFTAHQQPNPPALYVSRPYFLEGSEKPCLAVSRVWRGADGEPQGVLVYAFALSELSDLLASFELGKDSGLKIWRDDGWAIVTFPFSDHPWEGRILNDHALTHVHEGAHGSYTGLSAIEGSYRLYNYRHLDGFPLIVSTVQSVSAIMSGWRYMAYWQVGLFTSLLVLSLILLQRVRLELRAHRVTSKRLQRARSNVQTILESLPALVAYWDHNLINQFSNAEHERWFGVAPEKIRGRHIGEIFGKDQFHRMQPYIKRVLNGEIQELEMPLRHAAGYTGHVIATLVPDGPPGQVMGFFALVNDITGRKAAEDTLTQEKERFRVTLEGIRDGVLTTDRAGFITYMNPAASSMTGWPIEQAIGKLVGRVVQLQDGTGERIDVNGAILRALERGRTVQSGIECYLQSPAGRQRQVEGSAAPIYDNEGRQAGAVVLLQDITQARVVATKMARLAQQDALTGLANRRLMLKLIGQALSSAARYSNRVGVLYLDLDGFKRANDTYGHTAGDSLLKEAARRFSAVLRDEDTLGRLGGDEFVVLMHTITDESEAVRLAKRLVEASRAPYELAGHSIHVTVSVGIAVYPDVAQGREALIEAADHAMYEAKKKGRNCHAVFK